MNTAFGYTKWDMDAQTGEWVDLTDNFPLFDPEFDKVVYFGLLPESYERLEADVLFLIFSQGNGGTPTMRYALVNAETGATISNTEVNSDTVVDEAVSYFAEIPQVIFAGTDEGSVKWLVVNINPEDGARGGNDHLSIVAIEIATGSLAATITETEENFNLGIVLETDEFLSQQFAFYADGGGDVQLYLATRSTAAEHDPRIIEVHTTEDGDTPTDEGTIITIDAPAVGGVNAPWSIRDIHAVLLPSVGLRLLASVTKLTTGSVVASIETYAWDEQDAWALAYNVDHATVGMTQSLFRAYGSADSDSDGLTTTAHQRGTYSVLMQNDGSDTYDIWCILPGEYHDVTALVGSVSGSGIVPDSLLSASLDVSNRPQLAEALDEGLDELCPGDLATVAQAEVHYV